MLFSVVICTYNNIDLLKQLMPSLLGKVLVGEVIVVNNNSTDGTKEYLENIELIYKNQDIMENQLVRVQIIHNKKNGGVVIPRNQGLKLARCKYSMILDDDQQVGKITFSAYKAAFEVGYDIVGYIPGMVSPEVGAIVVATHKDFNHVGEGSLCMQTSLWKELNYFDEIFSPAYREGPDIQLRAIQKGKKITCLIDSGITHLDNVTLKRKDIGFDNIEAGGTSHAILMNRLNSGYYEKAYKQFGNYFLY